MEGILAIAFLTVAVVLVIVAIPIVILIATNEAVDKRDDTKKEVNQKKDFSWIGWIILGTILFVVLWYLISFLIAFGITVLAVGIVFLLKKKQAKKDADKDKPKEAVKTVAPKHTLGNDPKTYFAILVGYFFFSMAIANGFFDGPIVNVHTLVPPAEGMLYIPLFGLLVNVIICAFVLLLFASVEGVVVIAGLFIWFILSAYGFCYDWFMPFNEPHTVVYPALEWAGMDKWTFYPNPQWSTGWICCWFVLLFFGLPYFAEKIWNTMEIWHKVCIAGMVLVIWGLSFGQQLLIFWLRSIGFH